MFKVIHIYYLSNLCTKSVKKTSISKAPSFWDRGCNIGQVWDMGDAYFLCLSLGKPGTLDILKHWLQHQSVAAGSSRLGFSDGPGGWCSLSSLPGPLSWVNQSWASWISPRAWVSGDRESSSVFYLLGIPRSAISCSFTQQVSWGKGQQATGGSADAQIHPLALANVLMAVINKVMWSIIYSSIVSVLCYSPFAAYPLVSRSTIISTLLVWQRGWVFNNVSLSNSSCCAILCR